MSFTAFCNRENTLAVDLKGVKLPTPYADP